MCLKKRMNVHSSTLFNLSIIVDISARITVDIINVQCISLHHYLYTYILAYIKSNNIIFACMCI